jgi:SAM-dependent methyltransferase
VALPPEFTGERFVPGVAGEIVYEHVHRYAFARAFARGRRVLDAACGEGYGTALLAAVAQTAVGVDIDSAAVERAREACRSRGNARFAEGSIAALPLPDASVDLVVSFETVEHLVAADQPRMIAEFARVLAPGGLLLLSSPNRPEYSDARGYSNPFHLHELDRDELAQLLDPSFPSRRWYRQRMWMGSTIWSEEPAGHHEAWFGSPSEVGPASPPQALYYVVVAARTGADIPTALPAVSLFSDAAETELKRTEAHAREVMRLDRLAAESLGALDRQAEHVRHLETLAVERLEALDRQGEHVRHLERLAAERLEALDRQGENVRRLEGLVSDRASEIASLEAAVSAQQQVIAHRERPVWLLQLPWMRLSRWWQRLRRE